MGTSGIFTRTVFGAALSILAIAGSASLAGAQSEPAVVTATVDHVDFAGENAAPLEAISVGFTVNGGEVQYIETAADGTASIEAAIGDVVDVSVDSATVDGASLLTEALQQVTLDGNVDVGFTYQEDVVVTEESAATAVSEGTVVAAAALPSTGAGDSNGGSNDAMLLLALVGAASAVGVAGYTVTKRISR